MLLKTNINDFVKVEIKNLLGNTLVSCTLSITNIEADELYYLFAKKDRNSWSHNFLLKSIIELTGYNYSQLEEKIVSIELSNNAINRCNIPDDENEYNNSDSSIKLNREDDNDDDLNEIF